MDDPSLREILSRNQEGIAGATGLSFLFSANYAGCLIQDAREVATKFGKTFMASFFPIGDDIRWIVEEWVEYLTTGLLWGPDDPLFPTTRVEEGTDRTFRPVGLERRHWSSADPKGF